MGFGGSKLEIRVERGISLKEEVVIYKASEYVGKVGVSVHLGRREKARQQAKTLFTGSSLDTPARGLQTHVRVCGR